MKFEDFGKIKFNISQPDKTIQKVKNFHHNFFKDGELYLFRICCIKTCEQAVTQEKMKIRARF